jgi:xylan 1,4-beta-xylosidase
MLSSPAAFAAENSFPVSIRVDAATPGPPLKPIWRFFGADEPNYATMKHGKKLIAELGELAPKQVYFRAHNLLTSGDGTPALKWGSTGAYDEDAQGKPIYNWTIRHFRYLPSEWRPALRSGWFHAQGAFVQTRAVPTPLDAAGALR